jgi:hypothetical protein
VIAAIAVAVLSLGQAKAAIVAYETDYWAKRHMAVTTSVLDCKRRSRTKVACISYTRYVQPQGVVHFTMTDAVELLPGGIRKIIPAKYGLIDIEETLR